MSDWTTDAANAIDNAVGIVRERTVDPVQTVARAVDLRPAGRLILIPAVTLLMIGLFRVLAIVAVEANTGVWVAWTLLGGIFLIIGLFCWTKRNP